MNFQTTDNEVASDYFADTPITNDLLEELKKPSDGDRKDLVTLCREFERELAEKTNEVARLRELLKKVLFELEKVPFQIPKLTAFTAHRLADRYREQLNQLTK